MKTMIVGINARFVHTNLAVRYLTVALREGGMDADFREYTINQHYEDILQNLYLMRCDIMAFSCYIWNIEIIKELALSLKKLRPELMIVLGGPEVSYEGVRLMNHNDGIDLILTGEGEMTFVELVRRLYENEDYADMCGLIFRARGDVYENPKHSSYMDLIDLPNPYGCEEEISPEKIYYYETSRGCPFRCSFCLSGNDTSTRFLPMERVKHELLFFIHNRVKQVKLVDRTFNADQDRACELFEFLIENDNGHTNFHFEIGGELINEKTIKILKKAPVGLFQFEIGIQSTNKETLYAIQRNVNQEVLFRNILELIKIKNIHIHVDLIAGLPYEDFFLFRNSFNDVFELGADMIQLGFLKLIKGSKLKTQEKEYNYISISKPPYEVLSSHWIGYSELIQLKKVERMLNLFWNSGKMRNTINYALKTFESNAFKLFDDMAREWSRENDEFISHTNQKMITFFQQFLCNRAGDHAEIVYYLMHLDYYKDNKQHKTWYDKKVEDQISLSKAEMHAILQNGDFMKKSLPAYADKPVKTILSSVHLVWVPIQMKKKLKPYVSEVVECFGGENLSDDLKEIFEEKAILLFDYPLFLSKRSKVSNIKWVGLERN